MNAQQINGSWNVVKGRLKQYFANMTRDELISYEGEEDELIGRIQMQTGRTRDEVRRAFGECWSHDCQDEVR